MKEAKLLFRIRTNMLKVHSNYKNNYKIAKQSEANSRDEILCPLCFKHIDTEENILKCEELNNSSDVQFDDLYSQKEEKMVKCLKHFHK